MLPLKKVLLDGREAADDEIDLMFCHAKVFNKIQSARANVLPHKTLNANSDSIIYHRLEIFTFLARRLPRALGALRGAFGAIGNTAAQTVVRLSVQCNAEMLKRCRLESPSLGDPI